jgi:hypothetical protein
MRSRRLESLFGAPLAGITAAHILGLVDAQVGESFDLDFKQSLYPQPDNKRDLAGDVAAMANTAGGVIVLGVADVQGRAVAAEGVALSDGEVRRMHQLIASGVAPMPLFDILTVKISEDVGFYVIAVPRSPNAPHAVLLDQKLRYPKRNGSTTRYLSEPEVSAAYRDRFQRGAAQGLRIEQVQSEARQRLAVNDFVWLTVSLVPDLPGDLEVDQAVFDRFQGETLGRSAWDIPGLVHTTFNRAQVGLRMLTADGGHETPARWASAVFYSDGAASYSLVLASSVKLVTIGGQDEYETFGGEALAVGTMTALRRAAQHARDRAGAGGNALIRAKIVGRPDRPLALGQHPNGFMEPLGQQVQPPIPTAETVAQLDDLADPGPSLVAAASRLVNQVGQCFGVPEMRYLDREGRVRLRYWSQSYRAQLAKWAHDNHVEVSDERVGGASD